MDKIKQFRKELLAKVTRIESMEEELGIQINHLSFITEPDSDLVNIYFEVTSLSGKKIPHDIDINFAFYDNDGTITLKDSVLIDRETFRGFSIESCCCYINTKACDISRILLYLSKS